jgi:ubiquinone/menaquinone biosynthesis C-methylase UbiE
MAKDYFSQQANTYANFRPNYPPELYAYLYKQVSHFNNAWDCATGNGQVAIELAKCFKHVAATDISQQQLANATQASNITYSLCAAEQTDFPDQYFDLITVGQALHWFDLPAFFKEARRVSKPNAVLAVWGYALVSVDPEIDKLFYQYYKGTVGSYWDSAREHIENEYANFHFPFSTIEHHHFSIVLAWTVEHYLGYLRSWSATQKFINENGFDPLIEFSKALMRFWKPGEVKTTHFPVFFKLCRQH